MTLTRPDGSVWRIEQAPAKLSLRAGLPGARLFDLAANSVRKMRAAEIPIFDRVAVALPASWCVNSPAPSTVLRRWVLAPQLDVWPALLDVLEEPRSEGLSPDSSAAVLSAIEALGPEPFGVEAISKVLALLAPDIVPLMPQAARVFVLGEPAATSRRAFVDMVDWFARAVSEGAAELNSLAQGHREVPISAAQALDRLLWFDSEGFRHFPGMKS